MADTITVEAVPSMHEFVVRFPGFKNLPTTRGEATSSPEFTCLGRQWRIDLYPGGSTDSDNGMVSLCLRQMSEGNISIQYNVLLKHELSNVEDRVTEFRGKYDNWGFPDFIARSNAIKSLTNGTFTVKVCMKESDVKLVPRNPTLGNIQQLFNDKQYSDISFAVGGQATKEESNKRTRANLTHFHAHRLILRSCSPIFAELCETGNDKSPVPILDTEPVIFGMLLQYMYGRNVRNKMTENNIKDIIDASDKYGVVGLKLEAETFYVESVEINTGNVVEHLLYANSKNCALLNEAAMDYIVKNGDEVLAEVSFSDVPGEVVSDLLASVMRDRKESDESENANELSALDLNTERINSLRRMCREKGLDFDGSRKAMVALLTNEQDEES